LINFTGGSSTHAGSSFSTTTTINAGASKLFAVTYSYASGSPRTASGNIVVTTSQGPSSTSQISFNIV
jgi:hypothetical protein